MAFLPTTRREKQILLVLVGLLAYIGIEIYVGAKYARYRDSDFRAFEWDRATLWRLKSNYTGEAFGQAIQTNRAGFRGTKEYGIEPDHALRILALGDSRTYGFGVGHDETYTEATGHFLREHGIDAEAINAGTHGFSSMQCRAKLEQLLHYKPDIVILAPGYNDMRYLVSRPPDTDGNCSNIAMLRSVMDYVQISNVMFGTLFELGKGKLEDLLENPPSLGEVEIRVTLERFKEELRKSAAICRENGIQLVLHAIPYDPGTYGFAEAMIEWFEQGKTAEAIEALETTPHPLPNYSYNLSRYYLGRMYEAAGEPEKAKKAYNSHRPSGSLFGESVLRSQRIYFEAMRATAAEEGVPFVDAWRSIAGWVPQEDEYILLKNEFIDECHYTAAGHRKMGAALAQTILSLSPNP